jgi:predicted TIM-barrel fold metal-dependent hydrolase
MYFANVPGMDDYIRAADGFLADRIIYASCFPLCPVKEYFEWFTGLPIRPDNMERILSTNAEEFLGGKLFELETDERKP